MLKKSYQASVHLICLSLMACQQTASGIKPIVKPSVSVSSPSLIETLQPSPKPSSLKTPRPTATPVPEPIVYTNKPIYLDTQHETYQGLVNTNGFPRPQLFLANHHLNDSNLVWSYTRGGAPYLELWNGQNYSSFKQPEELKAISLINAFTSSLNNKGIVISRASSGMAETIYPNPVTSTAITFDGKTIINNESWPFLQLHDLDVGDDGNGYIIFSDERPPAIADEFKIEHISFYASKVTDFIPEKPQKIFTTSAKNLSGRIESSASIDKNGNGFTIYRNSENQYAFQKIQNLKPLDKPEEISSFNDVREFYFDIKNGSGVLFAKAYEGKIEYLIVKAIKDFNINASVYKFPLKNSLNTSWESKLDVDGNGVLINIQKDKDTKYSILEFQQIQNFKAVETKRFTYEDSNFFTNPQIAVNSQGNGKLFFIERSCLIASNCTTIENSYNTRIGYFVLNKFSL